MTGTIHDLKKKANTFQRQNMIQEEMIGGLGNSLNLTMNIQLEYTIYL